MRLNNALAEGVHLQAVRGEPRLDALEPPGIEPVGRPRMSAPRREFATRLQRLTYYSRPLSAHKDDRDGKRDLYNHVVNFEYGQATPAGKSDIGTHRTLYGTRPPDPSTGARGPRVASTQRS